MGCGSVDFMDGGTLTHVTVSDSTIINSRFSGGSIESSDIVSVRSVDAASAMTIASALASLSPAQLKALADAIDAARTVSAANAPAAADGETLGTMVVGDRRTLLGSPAAWVSIGGKAVPAY